MRITILFFLLIPIMGISQAPKKATKIIIECEDINLCLKQIAKKMVLGDYEVETNFDIEMVNGIHTKESTWSIPMQIKIDAIADEGKVILKGTYSIFKEGNEFVRFSKIINKGPRTSSNIMAFKKMEELAQSLNEKISYEVD